MNAQIGWYVLLAYIIAPILSIGYLFLIKKHFEVFVENETSTLNKGDVCNYSIGVKNKSYLFSTPITLKYYDSASLGIFEESVKTCIWPRGTQILEESKKTKIAGPTYIGVEKAYISDFFGLLSFEIEVDSKKAQKEIGVIPEIKDIDARSDMILGTISVAENSEDSEDTVENPNRTFGGFPGYDSREYVPGDPIKRINWKLSAKKNKLLIRLDDEHTSKSIGVVLDSMIATNDLHLTFPNVMKQELDDYLAEEAISTYLGVVRCLVRMGYYVDGYFYNNGEFEVSEFRDERDIEELRIHLANYKFSKNIIKRVPVEQIVSRRNTALCFCTPHASDEIFMEFGSLNAKIYDASETFEGVILQEEKAPSKKESLYSKIEKFFGKHIDDIVPIALAFTLSMSVFSVYGIKLISMWAVLQLAMIIGVVFLCKFTEKHKIIGGISIAAMIFILLNIYSFIVYSSGGYGMQYQQPYFRPSLQPTLLQL